jgi:hypothetical protein
MPGQYGDHQYHGRSRYFQSHPVESKSSVKAFGRSRRNVRQSLFSRDWLSGPNGRWKRRKRRWLETLDRADYDCVVQFMRAVVGCCAVQRCDELLLSWAENVLGKAAKIPESPQEK